MQYLEVRSKNGVLSSAVCCSVTIVNLIPHLCVTLLSLAHPKSFLSVRFDNRMSPVWKTVSVPITTTLACRFYCIKHGGHQLHCWSIRANTWERVRKWWHILVRFHFLSFISLSLVRSNQHIKYLRFISTFITKARRPLISSLPGDAQPNA